MDELKVCIILKNIKPGNVEFIGNGKLFSLIKGVTLYLQQTSFH